MIGAKSAGMRPFLLSRRICLPVQSSSFKYKSKLIPKKPLSLARFPLLLGIAPLYADDRSSIVNGVNQASRRTKLVCPSPARAERVRPPRRLRSFARARSF